MTVVITGTGSYLPERVMTNADLAELVDTSDEWIVTRTGISERRIAREDETTSDMSAAAAREAIAAAGLTPEHIDLIIVATATPDMAFPGTACLVQGKIGACNAHGFDMSAACSGFLYAMETAKNAIESGSISTALVIGAEKLSGIVDWSDRSTCVLFGDGAGAAVLQSVESGRGIIASALGSDGTLSDLLQVVPGSRRYPFAAAAPDAALPYIAMSGREVFKHAVRHMCEAANSTLEKGGIGVDEVAWIVPHQANARIMQAIASRLKVDMDKFYLNLSKVGNISAASVPVALDEAVRTGKITPGQIIMFVSFGGGFTWGAMLMEWGEAATGSLT